MTASRRGLLYVRVRRTDAAGSLPWRRLVVMPASDGCAPFRSRSQPGQEGRRLGTALEREGVPLSGVSSCARVDSLTAEV